MCVCFSGKIPGKLINRIFLETRRGDGCMVMRVLGIGEWITIWFYIRTDFRVDGTITPHNTKQPNDI